MLGFLWLATSTKPSVSFCSLRICSCELKAQEIGLAVEVVMTVFLAFKNFFALKSIFPTEHMPKNGKMIDYEERHRNIRIEILCQLRMVGRRATGYGKMHALHRN